MTNSERWPEGTTVSASSYHSPNYASQCSCNRTYEPSSVIDGDVNTFWNDDTSYVWPDTISVTVPVGSEVDLSGLSIVSSIDGYIVDFDVYLLVNNSWTTTNMLRGVGNVQTNVVFAGVQDVADENGVVRNVSSIAISVLRSEVEFSRIAEIRPVLSGPTSTSRNASSTVTSTSTTTPTASTTQDSTASATTSPGVPNTSYASQHKGVIIGVSVAGALIMFLLLAAMFWMWRRKRKQRIREVATTITSASIYDFAPELYYKDIASTANRPPTSPVSPQTPALVHAPWGMPAYSPDTVGRRPTYIPYRRSIHELESR